MSSFVIREHLVEIGYVHNILGQFWLELGFSLFLQKSLHVDVCEPRVGQDFADISFGADTLVGVLLEACLDEVLAFFAHHDPIRTS